MTTMQIVLENSKNEVIARIDDSPESEIMDSPYMGLYEKTLFENWTLIPPSIDTESMWSHHFERESRYIWESTLQRIAIVPPHLNGYKRLENHESWRMHVMSVNRAIYDYDLLQAKRKESRGIVSKEKLYARINMVNNKNDKAYTLRRTVHHIAMRLENNKLIVSGDLLLHHTKYNLVWIGGKHVDSTAKMMPTSRVKIRAYVEAIVTPKNGIYASIGNDDSALLNFSVIRATVLDREIYEYTIETTGLDKISEQYGKNANQKKQPIQGCQTFEQWKKESERKEMDSRVNRPLHAVDLQMKRNAQRVKYSELYRAKLANKPESFEISNEVKEFELPAIRPVYEEESAPSYAI
jgi:hypothetical protein